MPKKRAEGGVMRKSLVMAVRVACCGYLAFCYIVGGMYMHDLIFGEIAGNLVRWVVWAWVGISMYMSFVVTLMLIIGRKVFERFENEIQ